MKTAENQHQEKTPNQQSTILADHSPKKAKISAEKPILYEYTASNQHQSIQLKRPVTIPSIRIPGRSLAFLCPILFCIHSFLCELSQIPPIQYIFVTLFISFAVNYVFLIRKYEIPPFLNEKKHDDSLKFACLLTFVAILCSLSWGWSGTGGLISAFVWELLKGKKLTKFSFLYLMIAIGCLMIEKHFAVVKLVQLIPGVLFGVANSIVFDLKQASTYTVTHQFIFFISVCLPMVFPTATIVVPNLYQWGIMAVTGLTIYFTVLCTVKLMQNERVSIVMAILSGIFVLASSSYWGTTDFIGAILILLGIVFVVKKQFFDLDF